MPFSVSKNGLCMRISAYPFVQNDFFFKVPYVSWIFFGPQNSILSFEHKEKNFFFPTLNLMILQTVWNECVRFGGFINIQISYKILGESYCASVERGFLILIFQNFDNHGGGDLVPWIMKPWIFKILGGSVYYRVE
jgi:hypothetical protein